MRFSEAVRRAFALSARRYPFTRIPGNYAPTQAPDLSQAPILMKHFAVPARYLYIRPRGRARMETFWKDLRYAFRMLLKSPGFTLIAMLALGLGIGANTAIFSVFNGILWRPLPAKDSQRLVILASKPRAIDFPLQLSYPDFKDYRELKTVFSDLAAYVPNPVNFGAEGRPDRAWAEMVSGNYFSMLGLEAARGRTFASDEGWIPGKDPLMVLSYKYWQKRFGA